MNHCRVLLSIAFAVLLLSACSTVSVPSPAAGLDIGPSPLPATAIPASPTATLTTTPAPSFTPEPPTPTHTPQATATPTLPPGVLFDEDFRSEEAAVRNGWAMGMTANGSTSRTWSPNRYNLTVLKEDWISYQYIDYRPPNDFGVEIEAQPVDSASEYGIVWRVNTLTTAASYYAFGISDEGQLRLRKYMAGQWGDAPIVPWSAFEPIKTGPSRNKLGVIATGSTFALYVNGYRAATVQDVSLAAGAVGVYVTTSSKTTRASVSFLRMRLFTPEAAQQEMGNQTAALGTRTPTPTLTPARTATRTATATRAPSATPGLPGTLIAKMQDPVPCTPYGSGGCTWNFRVSFTETNGTRVTIQQVGRRYIDLRGRVWTVGGNEWASETITIPARGTGSYSSWVRTAPSDEPDLRGCTVVVSWKGIDAEGHSISGSISAQLAVAP